MIHDTLQLLIKKADQLNQSGQPQLAVEMLSKGIDHAPHDRTLHYALADILIQNEHYQDALSALEKLENKDFDPRLALMQCRQRRLRRLVRPGILWGRAAEDGKLGQQATFIRRKPLPQTCQQRPQGGCLGQLLHQRC